MGVEPTMLDLPLYLVANERPLINIDATLFINIALWLLLFVILRGMLWTPMLKLIAARESGMQGARDEARTLEAEAKTRRVEYEAAQKKARAAGADEREKMRADAKRKESEILAEARASSLATLETQRGELRMQAATLRTEIQKSVPALASDIASKVLGREVRA